jgi:hypothetical protein
MARTFIRQDTQVRNSDLYDDTLAVGATLESGQTTVEGDLNAIRSQAKRALFADNAGDWFADINTPSALDPGAKRGITNLNTDLHELERKRVLIASEVHTQDIVVGVGATGTLTATANFANTETVTLGTKTYTFQTVLTNVDGNVLIGASASDSLDNLIAAINLGAGAGTLYAAATTVNADAYAAAGAGDTLLATAKTPPGNAVATTDTAANASWGAATLTGGTTSTNVVILQASQLPPNLIAAIGAVTTRGTVAAAHGGTFGTHVLSAVSGSSTISPKNLANIIEHDTHDPILSGGRVVYALFQSESSTDGSTLSAVSPNRAQLSFVRLNALGTALEAVPAADIGGQTIHYATPERKALEDLNEQDFLRGAATDVPAATTVTRQEAYNNQGTTPVNVVTSSTLDLEGPGLEWVIRDDTEANLFRILEGSAGGTSEIQIAGAVDTFNVDAVVNDFAEGIRADTAGTRIDVGVNAGVIETTGAADLRILGAGELFLDDGNQTGSTWAQTSGIKLSDTTAEWDLFETNFGEVSLLNAINQAKNTAARGAKVYANVTNTTNADLDVSLADGNLDTALPDMSGGSFLTDYDVFLNGNLLRPGANAAANNDYYPGTSLVTAAQLRFEFRVKLNDVLCVIPYA